MKQKTAHVAVFSLHGWGCDFYLDEGQFPLSCCGEPPLRLDGINRRGGVTPPVIATTSKMQRLSPKSTVNRGLLQGGEGVLLARRMRMLCWWSKRLRCFDMVKDAFHHIVTSSFFLCRASSSVAFRATFPSLGKATDAVPSRVAITSSYALPREGR